MFNMYITPGEGEHAPLRGEGTYLTPQPDTINSSA